MKLCFFILLCFITSKSYDQKSKLDSLADNYILKTIEKNFDNSIIFKKPLSVKQLGVYNDIIKKMLGISKNDTLNFVSKTFMLNLNKRIAYISFFIIDDSVATSNKELD